MLKRYLYPGLARLGVARLILGLSILRHACLRVQRAASLTPACARWGLRARCASTTDRACHPDQARDLRRHLDRVCRFFRSTPLLCSQNCVDRICSSSVFLGALDTTIVATLSASIASSFSAAHQLTWLATAYLLSITAASPLYGRLAHLFGRRLALLIALSLFTLGTLACALAPSMTLLVCARFVAGCGGGGIMTTSSIIASDLVPLNRRGLVQGFANVWFGAGAALGGPLGGWLADGLGWRYAFISTSSSALFDS